MDSIRYAWGSSPVAMYTQTIHWSERVLDTKLLHYDWNGKLCGGDFVYAHNHSYFPHIAWWLCPLCSRKVCGYRPDPLIAAAQMAVNNHV